MVNSPTPAAARIALMRASATGLRRTLAIPGRASSSEEICDPPSSAGIDHAAPTLKVAPSYYPPPGNVKNSDAACLSLVLVPQQYREAGARYVAATGRRQINPAVVEPGGQMRRELIVDGVVGREAARVEPPATVIGGAPLPQSQERLDLHPRRDALGNAQLGVQHVLFARRHRSGVGRPGLAVIVPRGKGDGRASHDVQDREVADETGARAVAAGAGAAVGVG